jgi:hypothetical protein
VDQELEARLAELKAGQQFELNGTTYIKPKVEMPCKVHDYAYAGEQGGYMCVKCNNCISGRILNKDEYLRNGSIFSKEL